MPPLTLKASDTVFAVSRAITTVLKCSTNTAFVTATLARLKANTLEEAEQRLGQHLWSMLHKHQGVDIPPEVAEEISTLPLQEHTHHSRITTELDDSLDNNTTKEITPSILHGARFNEANYNDTLIFPPEVNNGCLELTDDGEFVATCGALHQKVPPEDSTSLLPNHSSSPIQPSDSGSRRGETTLHWLQVDSETTREPGVNNEIISEYNNELNIFRGVTRQESSYEDRDFYENTIDNLQLSSIRDSTFFDSLTLPQLGCLEESQFFEDVVLDTDFPDPGGGGEKAQDNRSSSSRNIINQALSLLSCALDREEPCVSQADLIEAAISGLSKNLNQRVSQSTPIFQHQQHVRSQTSMPPSQNSTQNSRLSGIAQGCQDLSNAINPSQELTATLRITDEYIPPRDNIVCLESPQDNQSLVCDKMQDSSSVLHESIGSWHASEELINYVTETDLDHTSHTEQVEATSDGDNESVDVVTENIEESSIILSGESECLDIYDISDTESASLGKESTSSKVDQAKITSPGSINLPQARAASEFGENDGEVEEIQFIKFVSADESHSSHSSMLPRLKCNTVTAIYNHNISLQNIVVSQSYHEEQILCDRKLLSNSSSNILGASIIYPSQQLFPRLLSVNEPRPHDSIVPPNDEKYLHDAPSKRLSISAVKIPSRTANNVPCSSSSSSPVSKRLFLQSPDIATQLPTYSDTQDSANKQATLLSCAQDLPGSNTRDTGISPRPHLSHHVVLKQFPEEVSSNSTGHDEDQSYLSSKVSLHNENGEAPKQISSWQILTDPLNSGGRMSQYSPKKCSGFLQTLHEQTVLDLLENDDKESQASAADESEDNSESLLKDMTFDPVHLTLSYARHLSSCSSSCENTNFIQSVNEFEGNDVKDHSDLLTVSINQDFENSTKSLINLTGNTNDLYNNKSQVHQLKDTIILDTITVEYKAPQSSNNINKVGKECAADNQLLISHQYETGRLLSEPQGRKRDLGDHTLSELRGLQDGVSDVTVPEKNSSQPLKLEDGQPETTISRDKLPAKVQFRNVLFRPRLDGDAPQDSIPAAGQQDNELQEVPITESKQLHLKTADGDLQNRRMSTNMLHEAATPGDVLGTTAVKKGKLPDVAQLKNPVNQISMVDIVSGDDLNKAPLTEFTRQNCEVVNMAEDEPAGIPLSGDALEATRSVNQLPEVAMTEDELWETSIPEVIKPDDHFEGIAICYSLINENSKKDINVKTPREETFIPNVTMQDDDDGPQDVNVIKGSLPPDFTMMEEPSVDEEPSPQLHALQDHSIEAMALFERQALGLAIEDPREAMSLEYDPTTQQVSTGRDTDSSWPGDGSGEVIMLDIASSDHELSPSLDYNSDDFIW